MRAILTFGVLNDWLVKNPFAKTKSLISMAAEVGRDRVLTFAEETRLLKACIGVRSHVRPILICALDTAMRKGEILKMRWADIRFSDGEIFIPQTNTKTEESRRVAMTPRLRQELEGLWEFSPKSQNGLVFGIVDNFYKAWTSVCREADITNFHFHDCRHTATTRMIASGSSHTEVMKITGHSQLKTFLRYLNITTEAANAVATRLSNYVDEKRYTIDEVSDYIN